MREGQTINMYLQESGEMYLETILLLAKKGASVRSIDVAEHMGFSKPSVSRAIGLLKNGGYVVTDNSGSLILTDTGKEIAEKIYDRHNTISKLLMLLGVDEKTATEDACKMEHVISDKSFEAISKHLKHAEHK